MNEEISLARLAPDLRFLARRDARARAEWKVHGVPPTDNATRIMYTRHMWIPCFGTARSTHQHFLIEGLRAGIHHPAPKSPAPFQPDPRPHYIFGTGVLAGFHFAPTANQVSFIQLSSVTFIHSRIYTTASRLIHSDFNACTLQQFLSIAGKSNI